MVRYAQEHDHEVVVLDDLSTGHEWAVKDCEILRVNLSDLFLLFIYAEVLGMVGVFYKENRIPVTLPLVIAITALTRMIVIQTKGLDSVNIIFEASGILLLAIAAYIMSKKEELSLKKLIKKKQIEDCLEDKS
jgi:protein PsiE